MMGEEDGPRLDTAESDAPSVEEVVVRIRATPPDPAAFHPPRKSLQEVLADLAQNPPAPSDISPEEWDRLWAAFEQDLKALDRADDIAEGRL